MAWAGGRPRSSTRGTVNTNPMPTSAEGMNASITGSPTSSNRGPNRLVIRLPSRLRLPRRRK
ncbi:hypothetical protein D3C76_1791670 [compost metagenome]